MLPKIPFSTLYSEFQLNEVHPIVRANGTESPYQRTLLTCKPLYYEGAIADYTAAIQKKPDAAIAYNNRAVARIKQGDYQGAVEDWTQASQRGAGDASLYYNRGVAYSRIGNRQAAVAEIKLMSMRF